MSDLLNSAAVGSRSGEDAQKILQAYITTNPVMAQNHTLQAEPKGTGAGDKLIEPR